MFLLTFFTDLLSWITFVTPSCRYIHWINILYSGFPSKLNLQDPFSVQIMKIPYLPLNWVCLRVFLILYNRKKNTKPMKTSEKRYKKQYTHIKKRIRGGTRKQIWQGWTHTARRTWTCGRTHPFAKSIENFHCFVFVCR